VEEPKERSEEVEQLPMPPAARAAIEQRLPWKEWTGDSVKKDWAQKARKTEKMDAREVNEGHGKQCSTKIKREGEGGETWEWIG
jgi:hypothetical protein